MIPGARGLERLCGSRVVIWGVGVEGRDVASAALSRGAQVIFVDDRHADLGRISVDGAELEVLAPAVLAERRYDCVVRSPGVSVYRRELAEAKRSGSTVTSATAMWLEDFSSSRIVGVTGTKGKTTTAWLTALLLEASGVGARLGGNMGTPLTALYSCGRTDVYVVEISSFQAADVSVSPPVGVLTLLAPDHLDWHHGYDNYVRDKLNLFDHLQGISLAVNSDSAEAMAHTVRYANRFPYGSSGPIRVEDASICFEGSLIVEASSLGLRGDHNLSNLCGALSACTLIGADLPDPAGVRRAVQNMPALPSRLETIAVSDGVEFVNDALASNPAGTLAALRTFAGRTIGVIIGGHDRGVDLDPLVAEIAHMSPVPFVVSLPDLGSRLASALRSSVPGVVCVEVDALADAVKKAKDLVGEEGVVVFSPAAPTPPSEGSYLQRGALFNEAVADLVGART